MAPKCPFPCLSAFGLGELIFPAPSSSSRGEGGDAYPCATSSSGGRAWWHMALSSLKGAGCPVTVMPRGTPGLLPTLSACSASTHHTVTTGCALTRDCALTIDHSMPMDCAMTHFVA